MLVVSNAGWSMIGISNWLLVSLLSLLPFLNSILFTYTVVATNTMYMYRPKYKVTHGMCDDVLTHLLACYAIITSCLIYMLLIYVI